MAGPRRCWTRSSLVTWTIRNFRTPPFRFWRRKSSTQYTRAKKQRPEAKRCHSRYAGGRLLRGAPFPIPNRRQVLAMLRDVLLVLDALVADGLLGVRSLGPKLWHAINHVGHEMKAVQVV